jgi:hypothetical protein
MLDAMKRDLEDGHELRTAAWKDMLRHPRGKTGWGGDPWKAPQEILGADNLHFKTAAAIANSYALQWIVSGDVSDAKKAIEVINHWSFTMKSIRPKPDDGHQHTRLIMGIHSGYWAQAGELLRCSDAPWPDEEQKQFERWLRDVILPAMEPRPSTYNGNWDAAITWSTLAIAVFLDDRELFDENIERLKTGDTNARLTHYLLPSGQCQETGRDQDHAQMGIDFLARACEIAWNQGIDLYDFEKVSIGKSVEYLARYNLGDDDVPFEVYPSPVGEGTMLTIKPRSHRINAEDDSAHSTSWSTITTMIARGRRCPAPEECWNTRASKTPAITAIIGIRSALLSSRNRNSGAVLIVLRPAFYGVRKIMLDGIKSSLSVISVPLSSMV